MQLTASASLICPRRITAASLGARPRKVNYRRARMSSAARSPGYAIVSTVSMGSSMEISDRRSSQCGGMHM
jgi:hypothetical protein